MRNSRLLLLLFLSIFMAACNNTKNTEVDEAEELVGDAIEESQDMKYELSRFEPSTEYADAAITGMTYKNGMFNFTLADGEYKLGMQTPDAGQKMCANSDKGQHIHLIVDNAPYSAQYTPSFEYDIADGDHYLLAFLSRSYHESIKTEAASVIKKIAVANKSITSEEDVTEPMVFYSRPKGTYTGKANTDKVMLDFYLANATLGEDYRVKADINGEVHYITSWEPFYIMGLPMGENTITLTLEDIDGNKVDTPLNPVTRTFTLEADPMEEAANQ
ncbi:MAG: hypothetical protein R2824_20210 [Saprospiraceae bacterium]|nr:hypothetical protein [Lewinella sp.]